MKQTLSKLFTWKPEASTLAAFLAGAVVVGLSMAMIPTREILWLNIVIRDELMIIMAGIFFPLWYIFHRGENLADFGLTWKRWYVYLPINLVLGSLLLQMFLQEVPLPADFAMTADRLWRILFIMIAGIFEVMIFYSFLRTLFERAFGIIPGIILAAIFYSLHHAGFQPEFGKLLVVGMMYALVFRLGNSALLLYPFFWGVGACYDVLVQSQVVADIHYPLARSLVLLVLLALVITWARRKRRIISGG